MKNILFITNSIGFGGASKMLCFVAESLAMRGYQVHIINRKSTMDISGYERKVLDRIQISRLSKVGRFQEVQQIVSIAKKFHADIIIGFTQIPNMYAKIAGSILRIPSIMSERGDPARMGVGIGTKNRIALEIINRSSGGVFQTEGAKSFYGKGLQKRGVVIPNPIFVKGELPDVKQNQRRKTIVSVGRLDNFQKRYDVMLKAFALFSEKHPEYVLKLYGRGSDEEKIREWVNDMGLVGKVRFMGLSTQPMQDIAYDGIFLITSDFEGISNSLLEAMAVGLPCVSTDHTPGGARLLIADHKNGLLVPVEDIQKLAEALCEFADNPVLAENCGRQARDVLFRFAPERIIDQWEEYILRLTG